MKMMGPNVVGVIHLRAWPGRSSLAHRLAAMIYGPEGVQADSTQNDRFIFDDRAVFADTAELRQELELLFSAAVSRS